jgi:hypothetical protein
MDLTTDLTLLDLRQKANCILLKVLPYSNFHEEINCDDSKEVF